MAYLPPPIRSRWSLFSAFCLAAVLSSSCFAKVELPSIFGDHMVLQRDMENRVWGKGDPGKEVTVRFAGQEHVCQTDDDGYWSTTLEPVAAGGPFELVASGTSEVKLVDILVGEVWICSGQSNMEWTVRNSEDFELHKLSANRPTIRSINFPNTGQQTPLWTHDNQWMVCSPDTVGQFSGVGYFFGRQLSETLDVPIGLVNNSWGGSACEAWIARDKLENDAKFDGLMKRWGDTENWYESLASMENRTEEQEKQFKNATRSMSGNQRPANLYNGILKSHIGFGIRGAIWYQGESNAGRAYQYRDLFPKMISSWREEWGIGPFPFYWVQLADFKAEKSEPGDSDWAELREAQTMTLDLENTAQAVIIDVGEGKDIHPRNKVTVGQRLARCALARDYGYDIAYQNPSYAGASFADGKALVMFENVANGWRPFDTNTIQGFTIAGEDKVFHTATAQIVEEGKIAVSSPKVSNPVAVRYAWADNPVVNLYSKQDLPLAPFRSDDWSGITANNQ